MTDPDAKVSVCRASHAIMMHDARHIYGMDGAKMFPGPAF